MAPSDPPERSRSPRPWAMFVLGAAVAVVALLAAKATWEFDIEDARRQGLVAESGR